MFIYVYIYNVFTLIDMCLYVFTVHASTDMYTEIHKVEIKQVRGQVGMWDDPKHGPRYFEHGPGCVSTIPAW